MDADCEEDCQPDGLGCRCLIDEGGSACADICETDEDCPQGEFDSLICDGVEKVCMPDGEPGNGTPGGGTPPPGGGGLGSCDVDADCEEDCQPDGLGCRCLIDEGGSACADICETDEDCPQGEFDSLICDGVEKVCMPDGPPPGDTPAPPARVQTESQDALSWLLQLFSW